MDNPKKKKLDAKRISKQEWEVDYIRKIARSILSKKPISKIIPEKSIKRLAKAYLELTENRKKKNVLHM